MVGAVALNGVGDAGGRLRATAPTVLHMRAQTARRDAGPPKEKPETELFQVSGFKFQVSAFQIVTVLNDSSFHSGCLASVASSLKAATSAALKSRPPAFAVCAAHVASSWPGSMDFSLP